MPGSLPTAYPDPLGSVPRARVDGEHDEIRADPSAEFQFCQLPVRPVDRSGASNTGKIVGFTAKTQIHKEQGLLHSQAVHVPDRSFNSNRKTSLVGSPSHEAHSCI